MTPATGPTTRARRGALLPRASGVGFALAVAAVSLIALASYRSLVNNMDAASKLAETLEVMEQLEAVLSTVKDAETGQRGFLLTGEESYLEPFVNARAALTAQFRGLRAGTTGSPHQQQQIDAVESLAAEKLAELGETIEMRRSGNAAGALATVRSGRGKAAMDRIRAQLTTLKNEQRVLATQRQGALLEAARCRTSRPAAVSRCCCC